MIPLRVSIEGFLSYREKQVIDFDGSTLWMLWGPNGVGKSALFDAITFALFGVHRAGKDSRNAKELINHHADKFVIEFDFMVDGTAYRVYRCYPRKGRSIREAYELLNYEAHEPDKLQAVRVGGTESDEGFKQWVDRVVGLDYSSFTYSVLLLQGKSEQLLNVEPVERYRLLAELIDLSRYQRLYDEADKQRKKYRDQSELFEKQLQSPALSAISDEEMSAIRLALRQANEAWERLHNEEQQLSSLVEQSKQWERATALLRKEQDELQEALALLARESEITHNFADLQQVRQILPVLRQIVERKKLASEKKQRITDLHATYSNAQKSLDEVGMKQKEADELINQLARSLEKLRNEQKSCADRLIELTPLVKDLERLEELQANSEKVDAELARFPSNITQQLEKANQHLSHLMAIGEALPWLQTFAQARTSFAKALQDMKEASRQTDVLQAQLQALEIEHAELDIKLSEASQEERRLWEKKSQADTARDEAIARLAAFENVATKPVCELCGQEITGDHVRQEKERLQKRIDETKHACDALAAAYQDAQERLQSTEQAVEELNKRIKQCTNDCNQSKAAYQQAQTEANRQLRQLRNAYQTIKLPFKAYIAPGEPSEDSGWLLTVYPTPSDVEALQQQLAGKTTHESYVKQLREAHKEWQQLISRREVLSEQLEQLAQSFDKERAIRAREEKATIERKRVALNTEILNKEQSYQQEKDEAELIEQEYKRLAQSLQETWTDWEREKAALEELERAILKDQEGLPEGWQAQVQSLDAEGLQELEQKKNLLAPYEQMHSELRDARQSKTSHERHIDELNDQIASYPLEAQRAVSELEEDLKFKKEASKRADEKRSEVTKQQARMVEQQKQRRLLEEQKQAAERKAYLYKILADLLGRSGLQAYLMRRAEKMIVDLANKTLSGLSHNRMRLELRRKSDASTQKEKALDLVVYDYETGEHTIPIGLVSGSQRFRIAVSLALAIGRYTSREARRVESVIIDEGFGSLDKAGRDDMIQELNALREQLKRIILVSHQDEFAYAFPDRYSFSLVNGASHVSLMEGE